MVRLAGIEPTTPWFVAKYSIQLSYSRAASECTFNSIANLPLDEKIGLGEALWPRSQSIAAALR